MIISTISGRHQCGWSGSSGISDPCASTPLSLALERYQTALAKSSTPVMGDQRNAMAGWMERLRWVPDSEDIGLLGRIVSWGVVNMGVWSEVSCNLKGPVHYSSSHASCPHSPLFFQHPFTNRLREFGMGFLLWICTSLRTLKTQAGRELHRSSIVAGLLTTSTTSFVKTPTSSLTGNPTNNLLPHNLLIVAC